MELQCVGLDYYNNKSRQVTAFSMGLGSSNLERVVIPYANSPSTNPIAKITIIPAKTINSFLLLNINIVQNKYCFYLWG